MTVETPIRIVPLAKREIRCWSSDCGKHPEDRALLMEAAGYGSVVLFKKCDRCKTMNIIDLREPTC